MVLTKSTASPQNQQPERDRSYQASSSKVTLKSSSSSRIVSQPSIDLSNRSSLPTADSPEPYVSVGCLKCGAPDHIATNRNCPRPRKAAPVVYSAPVQTPVAKKNISKSPKKHVIDNHQLKTAKLGDSTKFWYYISDDSEGRKKDGPKSAERIRFGKDGKYQGQSTTAIDEDCYILEDDTSGTTHRYVGEIVELDPSSRAVTNAGVISTKKHKTIRIREGIGESYATHSPTKGNISRKGSNLRRIHENGLGSIPSLPWKASGSLTFSPTKQSILNPYCDAGISKNPKQKRVSELVGVEEGSGARNLAISPQKQSRKTNQTLYSAITKGIEFRGNHRIKKSRYPTVNATWELGHSPQAPRQPGLISSSRYLPMNPFDTTQGNANHSSMQVNNGSLQEEQTKIRRIRYNYMGFHNHIQPPRVRYAPDRVQGWRECRSMGTGLE